MDQRKKGESLVQNKPEFWCSFYHKGDNAHLVGPKDDPFSNNISVITSFILSESDLTFTFSVISGIVFSMAFWLNPSLRPDECPMNI